MKTENYESVDKDANCNVRKEIVTEKLRQYLKGRDPIDELELLAGKNHVNINSNNEIEWDFSK